MPLNNENKNFYRYCLQNFTESRALLELLRQGKEKAAQADKSAEKGLYGYVEALRDFAKEDSGLPEEHRGLLKFLQKETVKNYLVNPSSEGFKREVVREVVFIYLGMGGPLAAEIYDPVEVERIAKGEKADYENSILARTLGKMLAGELEDAAYADALSFFLIENGGQEARQEVNWKTAFLFALILRACWRVFPWLEEKARKVLLENYLYLSGVAGVPVYDGLRSHLKTLSVAENNEMKELIFSSLETNKEEIPVGLAFSSWLSLSDVIKKATVRLGADNSGFVLEEFLREFYLKEKGKDILISWLREPLRVCFFI